MTHNYCTLADRGYLAKLLCLLRSMEQCVKNYRIYVLALDEETWKHFVWHPYRNVTVARLESIEGGALLGAKAKRTHQEYCWLLASQWTLRCMLQHNLDNLTYVDADSFFFSDPQPVFDEIGDAPVAIPPHRFAEKDKPRLLPNGIYNVNFVVFHRLGLACLREWADCALEHCYYRNEGEHFADQGCWDWLLQKHGGHAIEHRGVNLAPWCQGQYSYTLRDGKVYVEDVPVIMYHCHEFDWRGGNPLLTNWSVHPDVERCLYSEYIKTHREINDQLELEARCR